VKNVGDGYFYAVQMMAMMAMMAIMIVMGLRNEIFGRDVHD